MVKTHTTHETSPIPPANEPGMIAMYTIMSITGALLLILGAVGLYLHDANSGGGEAPTGPSSLPPLPCVGDTEYHSFPDTLLRGNQAADTPGWDIQSDGKVIGGGFNYPSNSSLDRVPKLFRYNATLATVDESFNPDLDPDVGTQPLGTTLEVTDFKVLDNDKILVLIVEPTGLPMLRYSVAKLNSDGTADTTFGTNGFSTWANWGGNTVGYFRLLVTDAFIYITGALETTVTATTFMSASIRRLSLLGVLDASYGTKLIYLPTDIETSAAFTPMSIIEYQTKLYLGGIGYTGDTTQRYFSFVYRVTSAGAIDATFGTAGELRIINSAPTGMAFIVNSLGLYMFITKFRTQGVITPIYFYKLAVVKYTTEGVLDPSFGFGGTINPVTQEFFGGIPISIALTRQGHIVMSGGISGAGAPPPGGGTVPPGTSLYYPIAPVLWIASADTGTLVSNEFYTMLPGPSGETVLDELLGPIVQTKTNEAKWILPFYRITSDVTYTQPEYPAYPVLTSKCIQ